MSLTFSEFMTTFFDQYPEDMDMSRFQVNSVDTLLGDVSRQRLNMINHNHYPIVYKDGEAPKISDCVCRHFNCYKKFDNSEKLVEHLQKHNCYKKSYTKSHINLVDKYFEQGGEYICESPLCNFRCRKESVMIKHHMLLGSIKIKNLTVRDYIDFYDQIHSKHYIKPEKVSAIDNVEDTMDILYSRIDRRPDECVICCSSKPIVAYYPCMHIVCCKHCSRLITDNKCPLCRNDYSETYTITLQGF